MHSKSSRNVARETLLSPVRSWSVVSTAVINLWLSPMPLRKLIHVLQVPSGASESLWVACFWILDARIDLMKMHYNMYSPGHWRTNCFRVDVKKAWETQERDALDPNMPCHGRYIRNLRSSLSTPLASRAAMPATQTAHVRLIDRPAFSAKQARLRGNFLAGARLATAAATLANQRVWWLP